MKVKSHLFSVMRGSVAGITYSANHYQPIIGRSRTSPTNPASFLQRLIRAAFSRAADSWNTLSSNYRAAWNLYAQTLNYEGPLGAYKVTGRNIFIGTFAYLEFYNKFAASPLPVDYTPPLVVGKITIGDFKTTALTAPGTGFAVSITGHPTLEFAGLVQCSPGMQPAVQYFKGPYNPAFQDDRLVEPAVTGAADIDGLSAGLRYFVRARFITTEAPYIMTPQYYATAIAATLAP